MRLIDADALLAKVQENAPGLMDSGSTITKAFIMAMINTKSVAPTIDAVPVVRCKDCVHWDIGHSEECDNSDSVCFHNGWCKPDWFCGDGIAKDINIPDKKAGEPDG